MTLGLLDGLGGRDEKSEFKPASSLFRILRKRTVLRTGLVGFDSCTGGVEGP